MRQKNQQSEYAWVLGVDVAQKTLTMAVAPRQLESLQKNFPVITIPNNATGYKQILRWLHQQSIDVSRTRMVMEHTSYYWKMAALFFYMEGMQIAMASPKRVKNYRKALPVRGKTDVADACLLTYFGIGTPTSLWHPREKCYVSLQKILRLRVNLVQLRTNTNNSYRALKAQEGTSKETLKNLHDVIEKLSTTIDDLLEQAQALVEAHTEIQAVVEILRSIPGIGRVTAMGIVSELQGIQSVHSPKSIAAYAGVVPYPNESGSSVKKKPHISHESNLYLRHYLYEASNSASRCNPKIIPFYQRLRAKGHTSISAKIACARKLLMILLACVRSHTFFDPNHLPKEILMAA